MTSDAQIKTALDRLVEVYRKRPEFACSTESISATVEDGLTCTLTDGTHRVVADLPVTMGGSDTGPTPGFYARAGLAGCISMGIKMMAARAGHDFRSVRVAIENDFDDRATYGLCAGSAAPLATRVTIEVDSDLDEDELAAFVEDVLEHDTWFLALRDAQTVETRIQAGRGNEI